MKKNYKGKERRKFFRLDYSTPLACKVCKKKTVSRLLEGYTANISEAGLLCNIKDRVKKKDLLWLAFDRGVLDICEHLEKRSLIYQSGVIGRVVRVVPKGNKTYNVGIQFLTREEKNHTHIYPKIHFLKNKIADDSEEEAAEPQLAEEERLERYYAEQEEI